MGTDSSWRSTAFVVLTAAMIFAPLAWGSVTEITERVLLSLLVVAALLGGIGRMVGAKSGVSVVRWPLFFWAVLLVFAWIAAFNPKSYYNDSVWEFVRMESYLAFLPASVDAASTIPVAIRITAMAMAFSVLCWIVQDRRQRWRLFAVVALTGASVAAAGLCLKAAGSNTLLFSGKEYHSGWTFAVFRYHGHAAAFLNLAWPAALGLLVRSLRSRPHAAGRPLWIICLALLLTAVFANSSKGGHVVAVVGIFLAVLLMRRPLANLIQWRSKAALGSVALAVAGAIVVAILVGGGVAIQRWSELVADKGAATGRLEAYGLVWGMAKDAGAFGFGPGTFGITFPSYSRGALDRFWEHAHQDYLQVIVEWGWVGAALWMSIFAGGLLLGLRQIRTVGKRSSCLSTRIALLAMVMLCLHCAFDFPLQIASLQLWACLWLACLWRLASPLGRQKKLQQPE